MFDVADTGPKKGALYPFLWQVRDEHLLPVTAALEGQFHVPCDHRGLSIQLAAIASQLSGKFWSNGQEQIISQVGDQQADNLADTFQDAVAASVTYALLSRCGLHPEQFFDAEDFIQVFFSDNTAEWFISNKSFISSKDVAAYSTYGADQASAYCLVILDVQPTDANSMELLQTIRSQDHPYNGWLALPL